MLSKTEDTDQLLIQKFQELMAVLPFEEITIKKITEAAGLNRPTFYNYFEDKYQLFDIILDRDLFDVLGQLVDLGMIDEAVVTLFKYFDQNKKFYHKAFKVDHPISFEDLLRQKLESFILDIISQYPLKKQDQLSIITHQGIARYFSAQLLFFIRSWCQNDRNVRNNHQIDELIEAFTILRDHRIEDLFDIK